ncbi:hypothetical protein EGR_03979 [Echinococcus granulosus]|uniref:p53 DNA-binding domain-containing protein n=1 Tax=Echinococcus granulosus TaxID=6210 RepID=W6UIZ8_ECHGR|nr:hypothetical protein EGR_03979 [Echinococcus granulosus]EUB61131.1 hypothetical protein EGR_03979 [Echinococcus granulosus]
MSSAASSRLPVDLQARHPFRGQYDFRLDFDGKETARDCKFYADKTGRRIIFVNRDRPFVMRALFRLPLTPLNLYIRIVPLYIAHARRNEVVCRCPNHAHQLVTPESGVSATALSEMEAAETLRSFIMIQSPLARYCRLQGHLTVLLPIDRLQMALNLGPPPDHRAHRHHRERKQSEREERLGGGVSVLTSTPPSHSQSVPSSSSSYPMGVAAENLVCRIGCYTSCLGGQTRGAVELVVRLEEMPRISFASSTERDNIEFFEGYCVASCYGLVFIYVSTGTIMISLRENEVFAVDNVDATRTRYPCACPLAGALGLEVTISTFSLSFHGPKGMFTRERFVSEAKPFGDGLLYFINRRLVVQRGRTFEICGCPDPLQPPSVLGLDSVEVHCSSTPARDIRIHIENAASSSARFKSSNAVSGRGTGNRSSGVRRHGRRGLSEPSISTRTKRRLTLVGTNACTATDVGISGLDSPVNSTEVISASFSSSNASSVSSSAFIDVPMGGSGGGPKQRFYLVATKSKERAGQLRLMDDAWAAFDGHLLIAADEQIAVTVVAMGIGGHLSTLTSSIFPNSSTFLMPPCSSAEAHSASTENCEPP